MEKQDNSLSLSPLCLLVNTERERLRDYYTVASFLANAECRYSKDYTAAPRNGAFPPRRSFRHRSSEGETKAMGARQVVREF